MAKKAAKRRATNNGRSAGEVAAMAERQRLQRGVQRQRKIRALARQLVTATAQAELELTQLAHGILDRKRVRPPVDDSLEGTHG